MLKQYVTSKIRKRFPNIAIEFGAKDSKVVATILPIHASWKPIVVVDDETEVTVFYGDFTHSHYKSYQKEITAEAKADLIATDVVEELAMVLDDKVGFWRAGSSCGMGPIELHGTDSWPNAAGPTVLWPGKTIS